MVFNEKRFVAVFGALVFLLAVSGYFITVAPTVSFWDCGEFIACSYSMGIPHPPGTPLFVIIGRVVCLLTAFIKEVAYRINLISVVANSITVTLCYLIIVRLLRRWFKPEEEENFFMKLLPIMGGFTGALFVAFSYTWWFNCVEAEVYGIAMLILVTELWLGFKWQDYRGTPHADRNVETLPQMEILKSLGCDEVQGYFISRPVSAEEVVHLLAEGRPPLANWVSLAA